MENNDFELLKQKEIINILIGDTKYGENEREGMMYLFSYYLKIDLYNLEIKLEMPNFFNKK